MKISKSLLQSMAVGLVLGASATSCNTIFDPVNLTAKDHDENCTEGCEIIHERSSGTENEVWDCPACGMG